MQMTKNDSLEISRRYTLRTQLCKNTLFGRDGESGQQLGGNVPPGEIAWLVAEGDWPVSKRIGAFRWWIRKTPMGEGVSPGTVCERA